MGNFLRIIISLPLLAGIWMIGIGSMSAAVKDLRPSEAAELLARSETIDAKCRHLSDPEHQELRDYVARAEVAVAAQIGAERAGSAITRGAAIGKTSSCDRESEITVRATMDAARRAIALSRHSGEATASSQIGQTAALRNSKAAKKLTGKTASYSRLAAAYYVERRCKHLSHAQAVDFWKRIVRLHNNVLSLQGPDAVSSAKAKAIAIAKGRRRCNANTASLVRTSYRTIKRR